VAAGGQSFGEADEGGFGPAERLQLGASAIELDAVVRHHDVCHRPRTLRTGRRRPPRLIDVIPPADKPIGRVRRSGILRQPDESGTIAGGHGMGRERG
jgi:hypothetical protein